jgi:hypothetical protein
MNTAIKEIKEVTRQNAGDARESIITSGKMREQAEKMKKIAMMLTTVTQGK